MKDKWLMAVIISTLHVGLYYLNPVFPKIPFELTGKNGLSNFSKLLYIKIHTNSGECKKSRWLNFKNANDLILTERITECEYFDEK